MVLFSLLYKMVVKLKLYSLCPFLQTDAQEETWLKQDDHKVIEDKESSQPMEQALEGHGMSHTAIYPI